MKYKQMRENKLIHNSVKSKLEIYMYVLWSGMYFAGEYCVDCNTRNIPKSIK